MNARTKHMTPISFKAIVFTGSLTVSQLVAWNKGSVAHYVLTLILALLFGTALIEHIVDNFHKRANEDPFIMPGSNETRDKRND